MLPPIKGLIENTLLDWEGRIASILFLPGCNLRCPYCHAGHLLGESDPLESIPFEAVARLAEEHKGWVDGIVISGGEPTLHGGIAELCGRIRSLGLMVKLDTNGTRPDVLKDLLAQDLLDAVAMDIKAPLVEEAYRRVTDSECDVAAVRESVLALIEGDIEYEFRMTVCPRFTTEEDVVGAARDIRGARQFVLQPFRAESTLDPSLHDVVPYSREALKEFAEKAGKFVTSCFVRGEPVATTAE